MNINKLSFFLIIAISIFILCGCGDTTGYIETSTNGMDTLGCGYDLFGSFANPDDVKERIFDIDALNADDLVSYRNVEAADFSTISGESVSEYSEAMASSIGVSVDVGMVFSGSMDTNFKSIEVEKQENSFATVVNNIRKYDLWVPLNVSSSELQGYLTSRAKADLNDSAVTPAELFSIYGTHCITGLFVGGRIDYSISVNMNRITTDQSLEILAEADFKCSFASAEVTSGFDSDEEYAEFQSNSSQELHVYGGASEYGQLIVNDSDYTGWVESLSENAQFCGFRTDGLLPIWELCEDDARSEEIKDKFDELAIAAQDSYVEPEWVQLRLTLDSLEQIEKFANTGDDDDIRPQIGIFTTEGYSENILYEWMFYRNAGSLWVDFCSSSAWSSYPKIKLSDYGPDEERYGLGYSVDLWRRNDKSESAFALSCHLDEIDNGVVQVNGGTMVYVFDYDTWGVTGDTSVFVNADELGCYNLEYKIKIIDSSENYEDFNINEVDNPWPYGPYVVE